MDIKAAEAEFLEGIKKEESWAFERLYRDYYKMVAHFVTQNNGTENDARDHFQDVLIAFVKSVQKSDFKLNKNTKLGTFLQSIAKRMWYYKLRQKKEYASSDSFQLENQIEDSSTIEEKQLLEKKHHLMAKVFKRIGKDCQKLLEGYYFQKIPLREMGTRMGFTPQFVRVKKNRCMNEFRKKIMDDPDFFDIKNGL